MRNFIVLAALKDELIRDDYFGHEVFYTGVGKINASHAATKLIMEKSPDLVINLGTAGCFDPEHLGFAHVVRSVIEHDVYCEPLSERGVMPFDEIESELVINKYGLKLATGDRFVTSHDSWLQNRSVSLVDMEFYAIAKVAQKLQVPSYSIKYATDLADENSLTHWKNALKTSSSILLNALETFLEKDINL